MSERPNIVLILADDLGYSDLGCYGGEIETPNLDRLADSGLRFTHFYNNAKCMPTRASLLTGLYPAQVTENGDGVRLHARNNVTLAEMLGQAGYATMIPLRSRAPWRSGIASPLKDLDCSGSSTTSWPRNGLETRHVFSRVMTNFLAT